MIISRLTGAELAGNEGMIHKKRLIIIPATPIPIHSLRETHQKVDGADKAMGWGQQTSCSWCGPSAEAFC